MGNTGENIDFLIEEAYEFSAPKFYDFINGETELDMQEAELWFDNNSSDSPSPFLPIIKASILGVDLCSPKPPTNDKNGDGQTAPPTPLNHKNVPTSLGNPIGLKLKPQSQGENSKPASVRRDKNVNKNSSTTNFAQENQAINSQKPEGENARQILSVKPAILPHKTKPGLVNGTSKSHSSTIHAAKEDRKDAVAGSLQKPRLKITKPKEPEFETSRRARPPRIKSSAELEDEMMAKMPKFKARPLNKKILEAPSLRALPRSTPQLPEFKEFHLRTMSRANQNFETASMALTKTAAQSRQLKPQHLTKPKAPVLQTSLRARPPTVKSSEELEMEELEKLPKFKAKPLNKKILESKVGLGIFCIPKLQITVPEEFQFALDERIQPPPTNVANVLDKLKSEPRHGKDIPKVTNPSPFNLHTEERGIEKERKRAMEILKKQDEEQARVQKATPYPYTTDFPAIPPKPVPNPFTKPQPFQLESLTRHEKEKQREMEERRKMEKEEARKREFQARPVLKEDPIPLPEKARRPLTHVQEFDLHVQHRSVNRAELLKEQRMRNGVEEYGEESESARMMVEKKSLELPHARPVPKFHHTILPQRSSREVPKPKS